MRNFRFFSLSTLSYSSRMYSKMPGLSLPELSLLPIALSIKLIRKSAVCKFLDLRAIQYLNMSNIGKRQFGPNEKAFKYEFSLDIIRYRTVVPLPCSLKFMWKRNNQSIETKNQIAVLPNTINELIVNEKLSNLSTLMYNTEKREFQPKESELITNMLFNGSPKRLASCVFDMRCVLDPNNYRANRSQQFEINMTPHVNTAKENKITFRLSCIFKEEVVCSEKSIGNGSLNMSGLSIPQETKFFEKKYDVIPSKDNKDSYSVASYNPNRYPSAKREREESSSIRKFDYGYLANLKSNISNGDPETRSVKKSNDNKTEMNEGAYLSKQLVEEQNKRSKAEAQLQKNKVQIKGLKEKIKQYAVDNLKLKEGAQRLILEKQSISKDQISSYQLKIYELNSELRTIKSQLDNKIQENHRLQLESKNLMTEKGYYQSELVQRQKRIDELQKNQVNPHFVQGLQNENADLKFQVDRLRRFVEDLKRQGQEKENQLTNQKYRQMQEMSSKMQLMRRQNEKLRLSCSHSDALQKKLFDIEEELKDKLNELTTKTKYIIEVQKQVEEYKNRLQQYQSEKAFMQRQIIRLKQEGSEKKEAQKLKFESDQKQQRCQLQNLKLTEQVHRYQLMLEEKQKVIIKFQQERSTSEGKSSRLLSQVNDCQRRSNELEVQNKTLKEQLLRLEQFNKEISETLARKNEESANRMKSSTSMSPEMDKMFRQVLQMQVQLKFTNDELARLRNIQESFEHEKWRAQKECSQRQQMQAYLQKIEKELACKNRALMIEVEKTKMMNEQMNQIRYANQAMRDEADKNRSIIINGQQQVSQMQHFIRDLQENKLSLQNENSQLKRERDLLKASNDETRQLQEKVKQLEERNNQMLASFQLNNKNLASANREMKDYQKLAEERYRQLSLKEKRVADLEQRQKEIDDFRVRSEGQTAKLLQEKRMLQKRIEMIMDEMHGMKKRFQEEKGRSTSFNRNQEFIKVRNMESQIEKKEKAISRLNKQKLQLQEQNVKMNVQVMKLLSEIQKYKSNLSNVHSLKAITQSFK